MDFSYRFPAVRGTQANSEYYIAMVPLKLLPRLFPNDDEYVLPEYRAQRKVNESRIPAIRQYILNNRDSYVFSALSASIDGEFSFIPNQDNENLGVLEVSFDARFLINDGQHRKAAILEAIVEDESLQDETISIVFFSDLGLERSQQMFTDLNKHAVKPSNSLAELYDSRDQLAVMTRNVLAKIPFFNRYTDKERDILGKYSSNLFTLNSFYNANKRILRNKFEKDSESFLEKYWKCISCHIIPWKELDSRQITKVDLREQYIVTQAVVVQIFGRLGNYFYENPDYDLKEILYGLEKINWRRDEEAWQFRIIAANGRMINNETAIILTCNTIKEILGLPLDSEERNREKEFLSRMENNGNQPG